MFGAWRTGADQRAEIERLRAEVLRLASAAEGAHAPAARSEAAFQVFFDDVPIGYHEIDLEGRIVRVNQAELDLLGYTRDEMVGHYVWEFVGDQDVSREAVLGKLAGTRAPGRRLERTYCRKNGTPVPVQLDDRILFDSNGRITGIRSAIVDLTERRLAEQSSEQLSMLVAQLEDQNRQNTVLNEMREFLLACVTSEEVAPVVTKAMLTLFPECGGGLFLLTPAKTDVEPVARWGSGTAVPADDLFALDACWGLRKGGPHVVDDLSSGLMCPHIGSAELNGYLCLPLMARGEVFGLLHLCWPADGPLPLMGASTDLATSVAGILALSIWNMRLRATLSEQAIRDPLTGLFNRAFMEDSLSREIGRAERRASSIAVIMADVDHFKTFNDNFGHAAGDQVLIQVAAYLGTRLRKCDIVCRYGGEEFTLILPDCAIRDAKERAVLMKDGIKALRFTYQGQPLPPVSISMGVSGFPGGGVTPRELLKGADLALYRAKQAGRDAVMVDSAVDPPPAS